jgi:hypothetical protein
MRRLPNGIERVQSDAEMIKRGVMMTEYDQDGLTLSVEWTRPSKRFGPYKPNHDLETYESLLDTRLLCSPLFKIQRAV